MSGKSLTTYRFWVMKGTMHTAQIYFEPQTTLRLDFEQWVANHLPLRFVLSDKLLTD